MDLNKLSVRLRKELERFVTDPPPGISCCLRESSCNCLDADIIGPPSSPYEGGVFHLEIHIPDEYPFQPPRVVFVTPIYHPNIDESGRICLDLLKLPPAGSWRCTVTISNILLAIQCLLSAPNPNDPLNPEIAGLMLLDVKQFEKNAREHTKKFCNHKIAGLRDEGGVGSSTKPVELSTQQVDSSYQEEMDWD